MTQQPLALVIGATGGFGGAVARSLAAHGWRIRAMQRDPQRVRGPVDAEWVAGDAMEADDVRRSRGERQSGSKCLPPRPC